MVQIYAKFLNVAQCLPYLSNNNDTEESLIVSSNGTEFAPPKSIFPMGGGISVTKQSYV